MTDMRTQECEKCGSYWFNGAYRTGTLCPDCGSDKTRFTGETGVAKDLRKGAPRCVSPKETKKDG